MKRKLPRPRQERYLGPTRTDQALYRNDATYTLWAYALDTTDSKQDCLVRVTRVATHEVPGSKWVEFAFVPEAVLMTGQLLYAQPRFGKAKIKCEWSDFLRLTRWRKQVADKAPSDQGRIAELHLYDVTGDPFYSLVAIDHPVRRGET